jgi:hypothetical protein
MIDMAVTTVTLRFICKMTSRAENWTLFYSSLTKNNELNQKMA